MSYDTSRRASNGGGTPGEREPSKRKLRQRYGDWLTRQSEVSKGDSFRIAWRTSSARVHLEGAAFDAPDCDLGRILADSHESWQQSANVESALLLRYLWFHGALLVGSLGAVWWIRAASGHLDLFDATLLAVAVAAGFGAGTYVLVRINGRMTRGTWLAVLGLGVLVAAAGALPDAGQRTWVVLPSAGLGSFVVVVVAGVLATDVVIPSISGAFRPNPWDTLTVRLADCARALSPLDPPSSRAELAQFARRVEGAAQAARDIGTRSVSVRHLAPTTRAWSRGLGAVASESILKSQRLVFTPSPEATAVILRALGKQIVAAGRRDLSEFVGEEAIPSSRWWIWRYAPRAVLTLSLVAAAFALPLALTLSASGTAQMRSALLASALLSLASPTDAIKEAASVAKGK